MLLMSILNYFFKKNIFLKASISVKSHRHQFLDFVSQGTHPGETFAEFP